MRYAKKIISVLLLLVLSSVLWGAASSELSTLRRLAWDERWCAQEGKRLVYIRQVVKLLNAGEDSNVGNPLYVASAYITPLLLVARADVNVPHWPLHEAIKWGDSAKVQLLLAARADPNGVNKEGMRPLTQVGMQRYASKEVVELLLDARANTIDSFIMMIDPLGLMNQYIQEYKAHPRMYGVRVKQSPKNLLYMASNIARKENHQHIADYFSLCAYHASGLAYEDGQLTEPLFTTDQLSAMFNFDSAQEKNEDGETPWWLR